MSAPARRRHAAGWSRENDGWLRAARWRESPNYDGRPVGVAVDLLVIHFISLPPGRFAGHAVEDLFLNRLDPASDPALESVRGLRVSSHFLIRRRGELLQFVSCEARAWHAGVSSFLGRSGCNDYSIGIELEGDESRRFTEPQYRRLAGLIAELRARFPIRHIAGHSDVAPGRKNDPGPFFDWTRVLAHHACRGLRRPRSRGPGVSTARGLLRK